MAITPRQAAAARAHQHTRAPTKQKRRTTTTPRRRTTTGAPPRKCTPQPNKSAIPMQLQHNPAPALPRKRIAKAQHGYHHWHMVFNYIQPSTIQQMAKQKMIPNLPPSLAQPPPKITCTSCAAAKLHPAKHSRTAHGYRTGEEFSSDICSTFPTASRQRNKYFMTVIDTQSRYLIIDFPKTTNQAADRLKICSPTSTMASTTSHAYCARTTRRSTSRTQQRQWKTHMVYTIAPLSPTHPKRMGLPKDSVEP